MLSELCNRAVTTKFFARMLEANGHPRKIVIDKSGANTVGTKVIKGLGCLIPIKTVRRKYLNNIVEQGYRFIKRRTRPMFGFKSFVSTSATLAGIEVAQMIRKDQLTPGVCPSLQFSKLTD